MEQPDRSTAAAGSTWCAELELSGDGGLCGVVGRDESQTRSRVLVRLHGEPLGYISIKRSDERDELDQALRITGEQLLGQLNEHLAGEGLDPVAGMSVSERPPAATDACVNRPSPLGLVSVVVCTRNRSDILGDCLRRLQRLTYPELEFIVVDNAPSDDSTKNLVSDLARTDDRFVYVHESQPGLSRARNRGLATAKGARVAFTDDDVSVDPGWIDGLVRGFGRQDDVACVTGLVCTANITNAAEAYFDARTASWSSRCEAEVFALSDRTGRDMLFPYSAGIFGTGANFAVDRALTLEMGGFDVALGAGTRTRGGEDLDMFVRVLNAGKAIAYDHAAVVWHHHRADDAALLRQMYGYGTGLSAYLTKVALDSSTRRDLIGRIPGGLRKLRSTTSRTRERFDSALPVPAGVASRERLGFLAGPWLYLRARRDATRGRGQGLPDEA